MRTIQKIEWAGLTLEYQEDRSILFFNGKGKKILEIMLLFMEDAADAICENVHYGLLGNIKDC